MLLYLLVSESFLLAGINAIRLESYKISSSLINVSVYSIIANVGLSIRVPSLQVLIGFIDHSFKLFKPNQLLSLLSPETLFIVL